MTVSSWADVVRRLGLGTSRHLDGDAIDIRTRYSTGDKRRFNSEELDALIDAAKAAGAGKTLLETNPPHLHVDSFLFRSVRLQRDITDDFHAS